MFENQETIKDFVSVRQKKTEIEHASIDVSSTHMRQVTEVLTFAVMANTKFENSRCSCDFLTSILGNKSAAQLTVLFDHRGVPKMSKTTIFGAPVTKLVRGNVQ